MKWKFWKKNSLTTLDPHMLSFVILDRMAKQQPPFNEWRPEGVEIPKVAEAFVEIGVWAYQLMIFVDCIERKFGSDTAQIVKSHLLTLAERVDKRQVMKRYFDVIMLGRASTEREPFLTDQPDIQIDCNVAKRLLETSTESEDAKGAIYLLFANALTLGRLSAQMRFTTLIEKMDFRPETVIGLRKPKETPLTWSEEPGCFERHLQRKFQNPLFPVDRRNITTAELISARSRDGADLREFMNQFEPLLNYATSLGNHVLMSECLRLRQEIEDLIIRAAEIGAIAAEQRKNLQCLYDVVVECIRQACPLEDRQNLENALAKSVNIQKMKGNEFIAQLTRRDTPVLGSDVIPSILSENIETVRLLVSLWNEGGYPLDKEAVHYAATLVAEVTAEGHVLPDLKDKVRLLISLESVGP